MYNTHPVGLDQYRLSPAVAKPTVAKLEPFSLTVRTGRALSVSFINTWYRTERFAKLGLELYAFGREATITCSLPLVSVVHVRILPVLGRVGSISLDA